MITLLIHEICFLLFASPLDHQGINARCNTDALPSHHLPDAYLFFHPTHLWLCVLWVFLRTARSPPPMQRSHSTCSRLWHQRFFFPPSTWVGGCGRRVSKAGSEDHPRVPERLPGEHKLQFADFPPLPLPYWKIIFRLQFFPHCKVTQLYNKSDTVTIFSHYTSSGQTIISVQCVLLLLSNKQMHGRKLKSFVRVWLSFGNEHQSCHATQRWIWCTTVTWVYFISGN